MRIFKKTETLEKTNDPAVQTWISEHNAHTQRMLDQTEIFENFSKLSQQLSEKNTSVDKCLWVAEKNTYYQITDNGLQRTSKKSYHSEQPTWETVFDLVAFQAKMGSPLELEDTTYFETTEKVYYLLHFSEAGSDRQIVYEFDIEKKEIIDNGFYLPKGRHFVDWFSENILLGAIETTPDSLTTSGYPKNIVLLKRNQALDAAEVIFQISPDHLLATVTEYNYDKNRYFIFSDCIDHHHTAYYFSTDENLKTHHLLPLPLDAEWMDVFQHTGLVRLTSDWHIDNNTFFSANSIIGIDLNCFLQNPTARASDLNITLWYEAGRRQKIESVYCNSNNAYLFLVDNLCMSLLHFIPHKKAVRTRIILQTSNYSYIHPILIDKDDTFLFYYETFTHPGVLYHYQPQTHTLSILKKGSAYFNPTEYFVTRVEAVSKDGTYIPYHIVGKKGVKQNGENRVIMRGYGGFNDCLNPYYLKEEATILLNNGFLLVHAHIRGGGEFGPQWHRQGILQLKQNSFNDFIAVAEDLIARKITLPKFLGIEGASNGGLLVGACLTQRPDLFNAAFCDVALLDMLRYDKLYIGRSWIGEYGDPRLPDVRKILKQYSPLHNIKKNVLYPLIFIQSSATDDRVHPYHARAMTHTLEKKDKPVIYFEKPDGGHTGSSPEEKIRLYTYWFLQLHFSAKPKKAPLEYSANPLLFQPRSESRKREREDALAQKL